MRQRVLSAGSPERLYVRNNRSPDGNGSLTVTYCPATNGVSAPPSTGTRSNETLDALSCVRRATRNRLKRDADSVSRSSTTTFMSVLRALTTHHIHRRGRDLCLLLTFDHLRKRAPETQWSGVDREIDVRRAGVLHAAMNGCQHDAVFLERMAHVGIELARHLFVLRGEVARLEPVVTRVRFVDGRHEVIR